MSKLQTTETLDALSPNPPVERVLAVFDNETERLVAEYALHSFDLETFKRHFADEDDYDPLMYNVYPVSPKDAEFVSNHLDEEVAFDFDRNAYFVECSEAR